MFAAMNLDFAKSDGLITAVIQDHSSGRVLMVGYMNEEAFRRTVETGFATFYSRSRRKLWLKGETSGHIQVVKELYIDCEGNSLLFKIEQKVAACHAGYFSCYYRRVNKDGNLEIAEKQVFNPDEAYKK